MKSLLVLILSISIFLQVSVFAQEFSVTTQKPVYAYGDYLSFTVIVPEVTSEIATFRIIDEFKKESGAIQMAINDKTSTLTAPNPFESTIYKEGTYTIKIDYEGQSTTTEFELIDSGAIVIPFWIKDVAGLWLDMVIDDRGFLKNLVDNQIITVQSPIQESTTVNIPEWYKTNAVWWKQGAISDDEFARGLQYLISINAIVTASEEK